MRDWEWWTFVLLMVNVTLSVAVTAHAVLWKRDSRAVIAWVGLAWLSPIIGALAYYFLGINRIERKAASFELLYDAYPKLTSERDKDVEGFERQHGKLTGLAKVGRRLTGMPIVPGNSVEPLIDGDQAYPAMLNAINGAQRSVGLLSYIFDSDRAGDQFFDALLAAHQRGVAVRVLVDHVGSRYGRPNMVARLRNAGIFAAAFLPTRIPRLPTYANLRNHRKILVVDGELGFTGGTNIREGHWLQLQPKHPAQCLHFRVSGPVVQQLQHAFCVDWEFTTTEHLEGPQWDCVSESTGEIWARGVEHGPDRHFEKLVDLIAAALTCAEKRVRIVTPYFLPNSALIQALNVTAMRGVEVEIYLPEENNIALVQWACTAQLWQILEKGCRVFFTKEPFDHTKLMLIDEMWSLIGSTNWDPRSLRLNFEFNVECYSSSLARTLGAIVDRKASTATEVTLEQVNNRSLPIRLRDGLARLFSPYL